MFEVNITQTTWNIWPIPKNLIKIASSHSLYSQLVRFLLKDMNFREDYMYNCMNGSVAAINIFEEIVSFINS